MSYGPKTTLAAIDWHQRQGFLHPLTCGNDSTHTPLVGKLTEGDKPYLECIDCDYLQLWVPEWVVDYWLEYMSLGIVYMSTPVGTFTRAAE
jgi:hypothetical protein